MYLLGNRWVGPGAGDWKVSLRDWSLVKDAEARRENLVAGRQRKSVHLWTDIGLGLFELWFLRDEAKREIDFIVTRQGAPWLLVEVNLATRRWLDPLSLRTFPSRFSPPDKAQPEDRA